MPPTPRQQRANSARGSVRWNVLATAGVLTWTPDGISGTSAVIQLTSVPSGLTVSGIPAWTRSDTAEMPTGATLSGDQLFVTWTTPFPLGTIITIPGIDRAVTGPQGQTIAAGEMTLNSVPQIPPVQLWGGDNSIGEFTVNVAQVAPITLTVPTTGDPGGWLIVANAQLAGDSVNIAGGATPDTVSPGEVAIYRWTGSGWAV